MFKKFMLLASFVVIACIVIFYNDLSHNGFKDVIALAYGMGMYLLGAITVGYWIDYINRRNGL